MGIVLELSVVPIMMRIEEVFDSRIKRQAARQLDKYDHCPCVAERREMSAPRPQLRAIYRVAKSMYRASARPIRPVAGRPGPSF